MASDSSRQHLVDVMLTRVLPYAPICELSFARTVLLVYVLLVVAHAISTGAKIARQVISRCLDDLEHRDRDGSCASYRAEDITGDVLMVLTSGRGPYPLRLGAPV